MGHYDECREENCNECGQLKGYCEHTRTLTKKQRQKIAEEVRGTCSGPIELRELGLQYGLVDEVMDDIDLQVAMICEEEGVWNCESCGWWCEESEMHHVIVCKECCEDEN